MGGHVDKTIATRSEIYQYDPDHLVIVGLDTKHGPEHPLFDERALWPLDEAMIANIAHYGVTQSVRAVRQGDKILVVEGRQRVKNAREANKRLRAEGSLTMIKVPVLLEKSADQQRLFGVMVSSNEIRRGDEIVTKAAKAARMIALGASRADVARAFGVTEASISGWLKLNGLSEPIKQAVSEGKISAKAANAFAEIPIEKQASKLDEVLKDTTTQTHTNDDVHETPKQTRAPRQTVGRVKEVVTGKTNTTISHAEIKKVLALFDAGEEDINLDDDTLLTLRVIVGEFRIENHPDLASALEIVRRK